MHVCQEQIIVLPLSACETKTLETHSQFACEAVLAGTSYMVTQDISILIILLYFFSVANLWGSSGKRSSRKKTQVSVMFPFNCQAFYCFSTQQPKLKTVFSCLNFPQYLFQKITKYLTISSCCCCSSNNSEMSEFEHNSYICPPACNILYLLHRVTVQISSLPPADGRLVKLVMAVACFRLLDGKSRHWMNFFKTYGYLSIELE